MTEEEKAVESDQMEEQEEQAEGGLEKATVSEEIKVQAQDLFKAINDLIRESTVRRVTIMRGFAGSCRPSPRLWIRRFARARTSWRPLTRWNAASKPFTRSSVAVTGATSASMPR